MNKIRLFLLAPIGAIYGVVGLVRRRLFARKYAQSYTPDVPTICIGNLAVGGTGKTPHTEYLIRLLQPDFRVATLSRGYRRKSSGFLSSRISETEVNADTFGDEPTQMYQKFPSIEVAVCEKRAEGIRRMMAEEQPPEVILLDDAYQHLQVRCGTYLLLTEYDRLFATDFPLPAGNLREFPIASRDAHAIIVTKCPVNLTPAQAKDVRRRLKLLPEQECFFTTTYYDNILPVTDVASKFQLTSETPIMLLSGIAHPQPLLEEIKRHFVHTSMATFADHHHYSESDIRGLQEAVFQNGQPQVAIITTEKDWMRLQKKSLTDWVEGLPIFILPMRIGFLFGEAGHFDNWLRGRL